jgi:LAO/AO transport system kinase
LSDSINPKYKYTPEDVSDINTLFKEIEKGNRVSLAKAITLVESTSPKHQELKTQLLKKCSAKKHNSIRIGITGVPGAGKSTLIENFGKLLITKGNKVAVLAIDPSSTKTKGSILGDKTRMQNLSSDPNAYIRPTASAGNLGGTAIATKEVMLLCEAAGFNYIIVETVGVGQSEILVNDITDVFLLLAVPGTGDELQGIKRGIMEIANVIAINKSDGDNLAKAKQAATQLKNALHLYQVGKDEWSTKVLNVSALENSGIDELNKTIEAFIHHQKTNGGFDVKRTEQEKKWLDTYLLELLKSDLLGDIRGEKLVKLKEEALKKNTSVFEAALDMMKQLKQK